MRLLKYGIVILVLILGVLLSYPRPSFAASNLTVTSTNFPPYNIILGSVQSIQLVFNYNIVVKSNTTIKLYEDGVSIPFTYKVIGNRLYIYSTNPYLQNKSYKLYVRNLKETSSTHPFNPY
ncbi:MAG TPA: hypothetical protein VHA74_01625, partial [Candidatus Dojkabacteria bacterium]|nr:hypothetical protein [Candidatus Dojkabacteria bacterium]